MRQVGDVLHSIDGHLTTGQVCAPLALLSCHLLSVALVEAIQRRWDFVRVTTLERADD